MSLPVDYQTCRVTGRWVTIYGEPAVGYIQFFPHATRIVSAATETVVLPGEVVAELDENGEIDINLPSTDDPDITPLGFTWRVVERVDRGTVYDIEAPHDTDVDLSTVVGVEADDGATIIQGPTGPPLIVKSVVANYAALPGAPTIGDVHITTDNGHAYQWNGTTWLDIGAFNFVADPPADVAGARTLGTGAQQAAPGTLVADTFTAITRATSTVPYFHDAFDRADGPLGDGWINGHDVMPTVFEPLGIYGGAVVVSDPRARAADSAYAADQHSGTGDGKLLESIGCAWRETGSTMVSVKIKWSGNWEYDENAVYPAQSGHHAEATPLMYVTPGHPKHGFGAWPSSFAANGDKVPLWIVGYIGNPPEDFNDYVVDTALFTHTDGTPRDIEIRAVAPGQVILLMDGVQVSLGTHGLNPVTIDPELAGSTLHGVAVDSHFVWPRTDVPTTKAIEEVTISVIGDSDPMLRSGGDLPASVRFRPAGSTDEWRVNTRSGSAALSLYANKTDAHPKFSFGSFLGTPIMAAGPGGATAPTLLASYTATGAQLGGITTGRIAPRVVAVASSATPAVNSDGVDLFKITALAAAITSMSTNLTGTPVDGQRLVYRIKDNGTARAITWGAKFASGGDALPTTTVISKVTRVELEYDTVGAIWRTVAVKQEP